MVTIVALKAMVDCNSPAIDTSGISASDSVRYKETEEKIIIKCMYIHVFVLCTCW